MMKTTEFTQYLKSLFPLATFFTGTINKTNPKCIGVYAKGRYAPTNTLGGVQNSSYNILPTSILVHWTESTTECETIANSIYETLEASPDSIIGGRRVVKFELLDSCPVDVDRDENNIVEMVIRLNILYERGVL